LGRDLSKPDLLALFPDGIETAVHTIVVAPGVDADVANTRWDLGGQHREQGRLPVAGLQPGRARSRAGEAAAGRNHGGGGIRTAAKATFGERALIARCHQHKRRDVLDHFLDQQRTFIGRKGQWLRRSRAGGKAAEPQI
jgi:putative transposase